MQIKICGMKYPDNTKAVLEFQPDYLGLIFYKKSPRFMAETLFPEELKNLFAKKTGVFVNQNLKEIKELIKKYTLDGAQLHGQETPELCSQIRDEGVEVIKAFSVDENFNFSSTANYENSCDYFLFDAKGKQQGGNGFAFNWQLLKNYQISKPFFLSGGIGLENVDEALKINHPSLYGLDLNSKVETSPGIKDVGKIKQVFTKLKQQQNELSNR